MQQSTLDRKKKNFIFSRKFPFVKSRDDQSEDGGSDQERKKLFNIMLIHFWMWIIFLFFFLSKFSHRSDTFWEWFDEP